MMPLRRTRKKLSKESLAERWITEAVTIRRGSSSEDGNVGRGVAYIAHLARSSGVCETIVRCW
jgi:hypothetical protein